MNNKDKYLRDLKKGKLSKMFWVDKIDFRNVIDFGAGDGALYEWLIEEGYSFNYMAIENNKSFVDILEEKGIPNSYRLDRESFDEVYNRYSKTVLVLSSVVHEIMSNKTGYEIEKIFNTLQSFDIEYIVIRDMSYDDNGLCDKPPVFKNNTDFMSAEEYGLMSRFEELREMYSFNEKKLLHEYFLKYHYIENWDTEKNEIYTWFNKDTICEKFPKYECIYKNSYIHPYLNNKLSSTLSRNFLQDTHYEVILRRKKL